MSLDLAARCATPPFTQLLTNPAGHEVVHVTCQAVRTVNQLRGA